MKNKAKQEVIISATLFRKDGTVEDLGVLKRSFRTKLREVLKWLFQE